MTHFEDPISDVDYIINMIKRDVDKYNCTLEYYKPDDKSSYDIIIAKKNMIKLEYEKIIRKNELILNETENNLNSANSTNKVSNAQISKWKDLYSDTYEIITFNKEKLDEINNIIEKLSWNRYLEIFRNNHIWKVRNDYINKRDPNVLNKGINWIFDYLSHNKPYLYEELCNN
jgi:hypothetical protein